MMRCAFVMYCIARRPYLGRSYSSAFVGVTLLDVGLLGHLEYPSRFGSLILKLVHALAVDSSSRHLLVG